MAQDEFLKEGEVKFQISEAGMGKVWVDGKDISQFLYGIDVQARVGEVTKVILYGSAATDGKLLKAKIGVAE